MNLEEINNAMAVEQREISEHNRGYIDGISDARNRRTPEHSQTAYAFPHAGTIAEQACYNAGYYEAKHAYAEASQLDREFQDREILRNANCTHGVTNPNCSHYSE